MTRYEEIYYEDIHRIADALEELVKIFTPSKIVVNEMTDEQKEKYLKLKDSELKTTHTKINPITISPSITPNTWFSCETCGYYQYLKSNPNPAAGDTPCTWCPKLQPTCTASGTSTTE